MKSMTGYGCAELKASGMSLMAEISSVNKRGFEIVVNLPRNLSAMELEARKLVQEKIARGRVFLGVSINRTEKAGVPSLPIDPRVLEHYHIELRKLGKKIGCTGELTLPFLLTLPGVMDSSKMEEVTEELKGTVIQVVQRALERLLRERQREGSFLSRQLVAQLKKLEIIVHKVERAAPQVVRRYRRNLLARIKELGIDDSFNDDRLLREVALFADRSDISEEIARLRAHTKEGKRLLLSSETAGRNLDFLLQEMNREINTIGSKANGLEISKHVIALKTDLEKIREQAQNLE